MEAANFGMEYEQRLIAALLRDCHFFLAWTTVLEPKYFRNELYRNICERLYEYKAKYNQPPDKLALEVLIQEWIVQSFNNEDRAAKEWALYKNEVDTFWIIGASELNFVRDNALKYVQVRACEQATLEAAKLIGTGREHEMPTILQKALAVGTNAMDFGMDYFATSRERATKRYSAPRELQRIPFFIPLLDDTLGGVGFRANGSGNPELLMFGGAANRGKSRALGHMAKVGAALGYNGIIFSAEQSEDLYAERLDMSIARLDTPGIYDPENFDYLQRRVEMVAKQGARLFIKKYPSRTTTIPQTVQLANLIRQTLGLDIHFIIWDYTGEFIAEGKHDKRSEAVGEIVAAQKRACDEIGCAGFGAFQLNREGMRAEAADLVHAAEDITPARVADTIIVLAQTDDEYNMDPPEMRWVVRKSRSSERNQFVRLVDERKRMCFTQHPDQAVA